MWPLKLGRRFVGPQRGATLVEVLVAIALTGIMLPTLATALITSRAGRATSKQQLLAASLQHEAFEAVRAVREQGWSNIAADGTYHPVISGNDWALSSGPETINGLTREIVVSTAQRDGSGVIVAGGGTNDPATKHVVVTVGWSTPYSSSMTGDIYLNRWQNNAVWTQTSQAEFAGGVTTNTGVTNTGGGEIELAGAPGYQTAGSFESSTFDPGASVGYNRITFTAVQPAGTALTFQVATNTDNSTWNYAGPDGTGGSFFTAASAIPLSLANARYLRYKAFFTGDGTASPVLSDVTINYSP
ncbi:MAG TPA: prepilin-type N-terminal cleavage/methylation domain-containing protein [Candidatus Saccharimonadales bacterium]|jgi:type II secretory pathway pseudopilin PulG|nr:prepilin-type N-terminal cleavage/methylation domain-containing protein [Candidatus Saccharimonadales bacterium]